MKRRKVWFITGSSSGLGRAIAQEALRSGYNVAATARKPEALAELKNQFPDSILCLPLDVTKLNEIKSAVSKAVEEFGGIDVLVNNAGYGLVGAIEEPSDFQIRQLFETNVFGVINMIRETLPVLRNQNRGHIINISSRLGFSAFPSYGYYSATKFAVQGLSEALAREVSGHGVKVTIAEPGGIRTNFNNQAVVQPENSMGKEYPSTKTFNDYLTQGNGNQFSDPQKIARILIDITELEKPPLHLPLGEDAFAKIEDQLSKISQEISDWKKTGSATGYEG
jgi:NADP-dependent 3-hydroxy acid dehydrogenase YdfG